MFEVGDVIFEGGITPACRAVVAGQKLFCRNVGDSRISHAAVVVAPNVLLEADPDHNISFRVFQDSDESDVLYVSKLRAKVDTELIQKAAIFYYGERYSYGDIILSRLMSSPAIDRSLGKAFCSGLVKRFITFSKMDKHLSTNFWVSPCELYDELMRSPNWTTEAFVPTSAEEKAWRNAFIGDLLYVSAVIIADSLKNQAFASARLALFARALAAFLVKSNNSKIHDALAERSPHPFEGMRAVNLVTGLHSLLTIPQENHWTSCLTKDGVARLEREMRSELADEVAYFVRLHAQNGEPVENGSLMNVADDVQQLFTDLLKLDALGDVARAREIVELIRGFRGVFNADALEAYKSAYEEAMALLEGVVPQPLDVAILRYGFTLCSGHIDVLGPMSRVIDLIVSATDAINLDAPAGE